MIGCGQKYLKPEKVLDLFSPEEVDDARRHGKLLSMEIELTNACNAACQYCYRFAAEGPQPPAPDELTLDQIAGAIRLAHSKHGLRSICILGGEPLIPSVRKKYVGLLEVCNELGVRHLTVTNGLFLTEKTVQTLHDLNASVCVKLNGMTPETHDKLVGVKGAHNKTIEGFNRLISLGYGRDSERQLAFETVIVRDNYNQIEDMWVWARDRQIIPYVETLTDQGRGAKHMQELHVGSEDLRKLFERVNEIDRRKYGFDWDITPPIIGSHCSRLYTGLYVQATGIARPCAGVDVNLGNLQKQTVSEILASPLAKIFRNIGDHITGKCQACDLSGTCYGCRGAAYQAGDVFGEDPCCWRDVGKKTSPMQCGLEKPCM